MAYHGDMSTVEDIWPHADALKELRTRAGNLSVEKAARRVDASRATWHAWEAGKQRPGQDKLKAIVEAFECPPELVGYTAPEGWELVPVAWISARFDAIEAAIAAIGVQCTTVEESTLLELRRIQPQHG